jgi:hypothetical protein
MGISSLRDGPSSRADDDELALPLEQGRHRAFIGGGNPL